MTICISATCDDGKGMVVAADRMFTIGSPLNVEFEPPISKIEAMSPTCIAMGSGNSLAVAEVLKRARVRYNSSPKMSIDIIGKAVMDEYEILRNEMVDQQIVAPALGPDYAAFRARGGTLPQYLQPQPQMYGQLFMQSGQFNMNVEIIVAGIDDTGSHTYLISHPGQIVPFDKIGYGFTGSGATHASIKLALELQHPKSSLADTIFSVYAAKLAAEVAPGVGKETELHVISSTDTWRVPDELIAAIKTALENEKKLSQRPKKSENCMGDYGKVLDFHLLNQQAARLAFETAKHYPFLFLLAPICRSLTCKSEVSSCMGQKPLRPMVPGYTNWQSAIIAQPDPSPTLRRFPAQDGLSRGLHFV